MHRSLLEKSKNLRLFTSDHLSCLHLSSLASAALMTDRLTDDEHFLWPCSEDAVVDFDFALLLLEH